jgi:hypothetical protein
LLVSWAANWWRRERKTSAVVTADACRREDLDVGAVTPDPCCAQQSTEKNEAKLLCSSLGGDGEDQLAGELADSATTVILRSWQGKRKIRGGRRRL